MEIRVIQGNSFWLAIDVTKKIIGGSAFEPFPLDQVRNMAVRLVGLGAINVPVVLSPNEMGRLFVHCVNIPLGRYKLEFTGEFYGNQIRSAEINMVSIVDHNSQASSASGTYEGENSYDIDLAVTLYNGEGVAEAPNDGNSYARKNRSWVKLQNIFVDTDADIMLVDGKAYKLTEYQEVYPDYIIYGDWVVGNITGITGAIPYTGGSFPLYATASRTRKQHYTDGTTTDLSAETADVIDFSIVSGDASITGRTLNVPTTTEAQNIVVKATYGEKSKNATFSQSPAPVVAYYGASATEPSGVDKTKSKVLDGIQTTIAVTTTLADKKRSIWVAIPKGRGWAVTGVVDSDNDSIGFETKEIDGMVVYHATAFGYIVNTYTFTIKKS